MTQDNPIQKLKNIVHLLQSVYANLKFGFPARNLKIIAVTGSDGKTTTTSMIYHILKENGFSVAYLSTIQAKIGEESLDTGLHVTTPDPWDVPRYLRMMVKRNVEYLVLEATSNGLQQNRLWGIKFDAATITNIRIDHLDYHRTWENYAEAKFLVSKKLKKDGLLVLNADDTKSAKWLKGKLSSIKQFISVFWYKKSDVANLQRSVSGMSFDLDNTKFNLPVVGDYNLENGLAVYNICKKYLSTKEIAKAFSSFKAPKGRMEIIQSKPFTIIIDFAHTPNALQQALLGVTPLMKTDSRLITVFGCAGKRDKSRREMGMVSAKLADITILTAEDPRDERLESVNNEIFKHAEKQNAKLVTRFANHQEYQEAKVDKLSNELEAVLVDKHKPFLAFDEDSIRSREDAIDLALKIAKKDDVVFITGKAHEQSLAFGKEEKEYPWSDHDAVDKSLNKQ